MGTQPLVATGYAPEDASDEVMAVQAQRDREAFLVLYDRYIGRIEQGLHTLHRVLQETAL